MKKLSLNNKGLILINLLLIIAIITILVVILFVILNPAQIRKENREIKRKTDTETILSAIHTYVVDNKGSYPLGLSVGMPEVQLGTAATGCEVITGGCIVTTAACLDLTTPLSKYLKSIPVDPSLPPTSIKTDYTVVVDINGMISVKACGTEEAIEISSSQ